MLGLKDFDNSLLTPNIKDYKGASPLHRASSVKVINILIEYKAEVNSRDLDGNIPLHVRCYGEKGKDTDIDAIKLLIYYKADIIARNKNVI